MKLKNGVTIGLAVFLGSMIMSSCLKTKNCNIEITESEKAWLPYDTNDMVTFLGDSGNVNQLTFSQVFEYADGEVSEQSTCQASAIMYINLTDTSDKTDLIGQYLLYKKESGNSAVIQSSISFRTLDFYQSSIDDEEIFLSANRRPLEILDSLMISDSIYRHVYHISSEDSARISYSYYSDIFFSENLRILRYDIRESGEVYEIEALNGKKQ